MTGATQRKLQMAMSEILGAVDDAVYVALIEEPHERTVEVHKGFTEDGNYRISLDPFIGCSTVVRQFTSHERREFIRAYEEANPDKIR